MDSCGGHTVHVQKAIGRRSCDVSKYVIPSDISVNGRPEIDIDQVLGGGDLHKMRQEFMTNSNIYPHLRRCGLSASHTLLSTDPIDCKYNIQLICSLLFYVCVKGCQIKSNVFYHISALLDQTTGNCVMEHV